VPCSAPAPTSHADIDKGHKVTLGVIWTPNVDLAGSAVPPSDVRAIARLAARQDGVLTREQLLRLRFTAGEVRSRVRKGWLTPVYRGVYAVGHDRLSDRGRARAAVLASGPYAATSFDTAAALRRLIPSMPAVLHVSLTRGDRRSRPGLQIHHGLEPHEISLVGGIPTTTTLRTLQDLGHPDRLVREALARNLVRPEDLPDHASNPTDNAFEDRMRTLIARAGLPQPIAQYPLAPYRLDFAWPDLKVAVETDGWGTHGRRAAFEDDRAKDAMLLAAGWRVLRVTWRRLVREPMLVAAQLAAVLAQATAPSASNSSVYGRSVASATGA
jgi:very-short-patch-repair endonuclease